MRWSLLTLFFAAFMASMPVSLAWPQPHTLSAKSQQDLDWITRSSELPTDKKGLDNLIANNPNRIDLKVGWPGFSDADINDVVRMKKLTHLAICNTPAHLKREDIRVTTAGWSRLRNSRNCAS